MSYKITSLCVAAVTMFALQAAVHAGPIVFTDTYDVADNSNINTDFSTRQSGGDVTGEYVDTNASSIESNTLEIDTTSSGSRDAVTLNPNFFDNVGGKRYFIEFDLDLTGADDGDIAGIVWDDAVASGDPFNDATVSVAFAMEADSSGNASWALYSNESMSMPATDSIALNTSNQQATGTVNGLSHNIKLTFHEDMLTSGFSFTAASLPTIDIMIDGASVGNGGYGYSIDSSTRHFGYFAEGNTVANFDNLQIAIPEPATFGMLAMGGLAMIRRRRA